MKSLENIIPTNLAEAIGSTLMHSLWQLAALALLLILVLAVLPQTAARLRYGFAIATMGLMLAMPLATFGYVYEPAPAPSQDNFAAMAFAMASYGSAMQPTSVAHSTSATASLGTQVTAFFQENAYWMLGIWIIGMAALSLRFAASCWEVRRLRRTGVEEVPQPLAARFVDLLDQVGIRRQVALRFSRLVDTPMVIGALKPVVLLPIGLLSGLSMEQVECILIHELGHVRRWDYLINIVQSIAEIILFYHPATWWVTKVIRTERENCCDALVVHLKRNKVQYARALLNLEVMRQATPGLVMASQGGDLHSRIRRITGGTMPPRPKFHGRGLVFGLLTFACIVLLATQSHTVVKAALPFFTHDAPSDELTADIDPQTVTSTLVSNATHPTTIGSASGASQLLGNLLNNIGLPSISIDSPVTKMIIVDDNEELDLRFNGAGKIVSGTRNGVAIPQEELAQYADRAANVFAKGTREPLDPMPPMPGLGALPPMPPMPMMGTMPTMPPMPAMPPMKAMPPLPPLGDPTAPGFDTKRYQKQMEQYAKQMEEWGKQYAKAFEGQDWSNYAQAMEQWGEAFGQQMNQGDWQDFANGMGKWAESFQAMSGDANGKEMLALQTEITKLSKQLESAKTDEERDELVGKIDDLAGQIGDIQSQAIDSKMEVFEAEMEAWSEKHEAAMAEMERNMEEAERNQADAERSQADAEREQRDSEDAEISREEGRRAEHASAEIGDALVEDGLIKNASSFKIKINRDELYVNGKKQTNLAHRKYRALVSDLLGVTVGSDWVTIQHNSR